MRRIKHWVFVVAVLTLAAAILIVFLYRRADPALFKKSVIETIEGGWQGTLVFEGFHFSRFPFPTVDISQPRLTLGSPHEIVLTAGRVKLRYRWLPLLFRRVALSAVEVSDGKTTWEVPVNGRTLKLEVANFETNVKALANKLYWQIQGDLENLKGSFGGSGTFRMGPGREEKGSGLSWQGEFQFQIPELDKVGVEIRQLLPFRIKQGSWKGTVTLEKKKAEAPITLQLQSEISNFVYEIQEKDHLLSSSEIDISTTGDFVWSSEKDELTVRSAVVTLPAGTFRFEGQFLFATRELRDVFVHFKEIHLETIPQYFLPLKEMIPFNLGFSGLSNLEMSLDGAFDHLSLHAYWDLGASLLTYGRFFSKPKDVPFNVTFDYLLKDGNILSGDFSVRFVDITLKGTVLDLDLRQRHGGINLITNKFSLEGWNTWIPFLKGYELRGRGKVLASIEGDLSQSSAAETKSILNLSVEEGRLMNQTGDGVQDLFLRLDISPMAIEVKDCRFKAEDSSLEGNLTVYNWAQKPQGKFALRSTYLQPQSLLKTLKALMPSDFLPPWEGVLKRSETALKKVFLPQEGIENFETDISFHALSWELQKLSFDLWGGHVDARFRVDLSAEMASWEADLEVNRLSLARFLSHLDSEQEILGGNLFLSVALTGEGQDREDIQKSLRGEGRLLITNGEFPTFDLLGKISGLEPFSLLGERVTGRTPFDDLRVEFIIDNGKLLSENTMLRSQDLTVEANGEIFLNGLLNYRLNVYLSQALTAELLSSLPGKWSVAKEEQLGPIPMLLAGPLSNPEVKLDPTFTPASMEQLLTRPQRPLRNFLPEEYFFERRNSS